MSPEMKELLLIIVGIPVALVTVYTLVRFSSAAWFHSRREFLENLKNIGTRKGEEEE